MLRLARQAFLYVRATAPAITPRCRFPSHTFLRKVNRGSRKGLVRKESWAHPVCKVLASVGGKDMMTDAQEQLRTKLQEEAPAFDSLRESKKAARKLARADLRQLGDLDLKKEDAAVQAQVLNADLFTSARRLCAYIACPSLREVDTIEVVSEALKQGKVLYVPRVEDKQSHMRLLQITDPKADCISNSMGILEPTPELHSGARRPDVMEGDEPVDLILMPGLAFDLQGRRLGRGGGYYDVFLQNYLQRVAAKGWKRPMLVALAYKCQIRTDVPADATDQLVDALVTMDGIRPVRMEALKQ